MNKSDQRTLEKLLYAFGPSNDVAQVQKLFRDLLLPYVDNVEIDKVGNLFAFAKGNKKKREVMFFGHADTVGFQVNHIAEGGFIYLKNNSGYETIRPAHLPGQNVILKNRHTGKFVTGKFADPVSIHQEELDSDADERNSHLEFQQMDADFSSKREAYRHINDGDYGVFKPQPEFKLTKGGMILTSAGIDDRISLYAMLEIAKQASRIPKAERAPLMLHSTISEETSAEVGMSGIFSHRPDVAIYLDVTPASDSITVDNEDVIALKFGKVRLGHGPVLSRGSGITENVFAKLEKLCKTAPKIQYQIEPGNAATENVATLRMGIPSALISVPCRYLHTDHEKVMMRDVNKVVELCVAFYKTYNGKNL